MSDSTRRQLLSSILGVLAQTAGTVVLARSVLPKVQGEDADAPLQPQSDLQKRADQVVADQGASDEAENTEFVSFLNGGFRNGGGFRKGGFVNGGGFRNGGFANGGGFRKGGFVNGGGFRNGGFRNF